MIAHADIYWFCCFVIGAIAGAVVMHLEDKYRHEDEVERAETNGYARGWAVATQLIRDKSRRERDGVPDQLVTGVGMLTPPTKPAA